MWINFDPTFEMLLSVMDHFYNFFFFFLIHDTILGKWLISSSCECCQNCSNQSWEPSSCWPFWSTQKTMDWKHGEAANTCGWSNRYRSLHSCYWSVSLTSFTVHSMINISLNDLFFFFLVHLLIRDKIDFEGSVQIKGFVCWYVFYITGFCFFFFFFVYLIFNFNNFISK